MVLSTPKIDYKMYFYYFLSTILGNTTQSVNMRFFLAGVLKSHAFLYIYEMKKILLLCLLGLFGNNLVAQKDTLFWFVAPEISNDNRSLDAPVFLNISAFNEASTVTIKQPANPNFSTITVNVPANTLHIVDLTSSLAMLENKPANSTLNYGLLIEASKPIACYYEVSAQNNPEIFTLKGKNALGTHFYTPFQNKWFNNSNYTPTPSSAFDIVATENNTSVTITPTKNIVGHSANVPFTITLQQGQTYCAQATSGASSAHLGGSKIVASKPIAITIKDDLMNVPDFCNDLNGDQLIAVDKLGTDYVVVKGFLIDETVFIVSTTNDNQIFLNGSATPITTLQEGQTYTYSLPSSFSAIHIRSKEKVYVLHTSGSGCESASAIIPPYICGGSSVINFKRSTNEYFAVHLIVRAGHQTGFNVSNATATINANAFVPIAGTNGQWLAGTFSFPNVPTNTFVSVSNILGTFSGAVLNGTNFGTGFRYGFFSDFNAPQPNFELGNDQNICTGEAISLNAGNQYTSYLWNTGATTPSINVTQAGTYKVQVSNGCGTWTDSVKVTWRNTPLLELGNDQTVCTNSTITIGTNSNFNSYLWSNGATSSQITVNQSGTYRLKVTHDCGTSEDSVKVVFLALPTLDLGSDLTGCEQATFVLNAGNQFTSYLWSNGSTSSQITVNQSGTYKVKATHLCGIVQDSIKIQLIDLPPLDLGVDKWLCQAENMTLKANDGFEAYQWNTGETTQNINIANFGMYIVEAKKGGCSIKDTITIAKKNIPNLVLPDKVLVDCQNTDIFISPTNDFDTYLWSDGSTQKILKITKSGNYTLTVTAQGCSQTATAKVEFEKNEQFVPNTFTPNGDGVNDTFVLPDALKGAKLSIFNRWGTLIYESEKYQNDWEGQHRGETYYYVIQHKSFCFANPLKGWIQTL